MEASPSSWKQWAKLAGAITLGLIAGLGFVTLLPLLARPIILLFISFIISASLATLVTRVSEYIPRNVAVLSIYVALLIIIAILFTALIIPLMDQAESLIEQLPSLIDRAEEMFDETFLGSESITSLINRFASEITRVGTDIINVPVSVVSGLFDVLLVLIISLYMLLSGPGIGRFFLSLFGEKTHRQVADVSSEIVRVMGSYVNGIVIDIILVGTLTTMGLSIIGIPYAPVLGVLAGLLEALPVIGSIIAAIPILLVALFQSLSTLGITFVFILVIQQIEGNIIVPLVMQNQVNIPRFLIPIAIMAGGILAGLSGALVAVPFVAFVQIIFMRVLVPFIRKQTGANEAPYEPEETNTEGSKTSKDKQSS